MTKKVEFYNPMMDGRHLENRYSAIPAQYCPITANFEVEKQNSKIKLSQPHGKNSKFSKIQFENVFSLFLSRKSSDFDWCADAHFDSQTGHVSSLYVLGLLYFFLGFMLLLLLLFEFLRPPAWNPWMAIWPFW